VSIRFKALIPLALALACAAAAVALLVFSTGTPAGPRQPRAARLASWQSVGGCGAGASTGTGGGVKWIGRNVRGGLVHVELQGNYLAMDYGYNYVGTALVSHDLTPRWTAGVSVPYLYKYMNDPYDVGVNLANKGPGDVNVLVTRRFGATATLLATVLVGIPTGTYDVKYTNLLLDQDRQLGLGKPTASLVIDKTIDNLWGPIVVGGTLNWRGGENDLRSYRAPSASTYAYASYLLGNFAPAAGLSVTGWKGVDRDQGAEQAMPLVSVTPQLSLEWAFDSVAWLLGVSIPLELGVRSDSIDSNNRLGPWVVALGAAFSVF
jgi:hypothetical protein